jgi:maltooligosyltrehalose trehalohydrolase
MIAGQFGALVVEGGVRFRVHAPLARRVIVNVHDGPARGGHAMERETDGLWDLVLPGAGAGDLYDLRVDDSGALPDPASRFQPQGVHGPSEVIDPGRFGWTDAAWHGPSRAELVIYELHVGAFTEHGTFAGVQERLSHLRDLGITAIELMPLADFAGNRNWGYDGVALYAPSRAYGRPDDLRALVDRAHTLGISVILDVVYNHLGPEGAYLPQVNPQYLVPESTPWGSAVNLDGPGSAMVRRFIADNAAHWMREYHLDGLRLDATHALIGRGPGEFMPEFSRTARQAARWPIMLHAEDQRNLAEIVAHERSATWGFDAVWADDFHHVVRRMVAGDSYGYYEDFEGTTAELERTLRQGWLFTGELSKHLQTARGSDPSAVPMCRVVVCIQNHDQIGNRALGERLHHQVDAATWRAVSTLLLTVPMTPLLFMGQEWAASTSFQYFTDLEPGLGRLVTEGRRREFQAFPEFSLPESRERIPDPQSPQTFEGSRLRWSERDQPRHAAVLALYRELLRLRRNEPALQAATDVSGEAFATDADSIVIRRARGGDVFWVAIRLRGSGRVDVGAIRTALGETAGACQTVLTTEDPLVAGDPMMPAITTDPPGPVADFARPGAVLFKLSVTD